MLYCSLNGIRTEDISIKDRGLAYGDGVFTTAKIVDGTILLLAEHIDRLKESCARIALSNIDWHALKAELVKQSTAFPLAVLKVMITAGTGGRGYSRIGVSKPNVIVMVHEFPKHYIDWHQTGVSIGIAKTQLGINPQLAGIKHLNRLEQVLIRKELDESDWQDLIVTDVQNNIVETSCANVFWIKNNAVFTPELGSSGVAGLLRTQAISQFSKVKLVKAPIDALKEVDAMIICNSVMGYVPVENFNGQTLSLSVASRFIGKLACNS
ncbi:aminodeoxychorismate lyase [Thalassotalea sp. 1_MG-2023]|uniref:aminodeoxychorismate lyase n=1 Tax=Thalassotalea sp. 1_MG-2023 TaxID=3062680 RepID=UPI0026E2B0BF|nr:aminodeoxychorismate lyase [Thalassotalea sp. 1_MG-2023]MDO6426929.1 aminodeoxychorismate lyase [Thalassotalea sp. 1_MG-2023]